MWKKHHKAILILAGVGVLYLLYKWYQNSQANASSSAALDTSSLPTVISTGGGASLPSVPNFGVQSFADNNPSAATVVPGTSASGVPANTPQAQEFATGTPIATPGNPQTAKPTFYATAQDLAQPSTPNPSGPTYADLSQQTYVPQTSGGTTLDLASFLAPDLRSYEIGANTTIGNKQPLNGGLVDLSPDAFQSSLQGNANNYCAQHPEACQADNASIIASLVDQYKTFIGSDTAYSVGSPTSAPTPAPAPSTTTAALPPRTPLRTVTNNPVRSIPA